MPVFLLALPLLASAAGAQEPEAGGAPADFRGGAIPVRVVGGRLVAACDLSTSLRRIPANLFLDYDRPWGLQLHNRAATPLGAETPDGRRRPITLHFPDFDLTVPGRDHGEEEVWERFTKFHSREIGENALVGSLGGEVLREYHLVFDLPAGEVRLLPRRPRIPAPLEEEGPGSLLPFTLHGGLGWVPVEMPGGRVQALALTTSRFDSLVDAGLAASLGFPYGDPPSWRVGEVDLARYAVLRPEPLRLDHPDGAAGTLGLNLLKHLRLTLDPVNGTARLEEVLPPDYPEEDRAFFEGLVEEDPERLRAALRQYPEARLAQEASRRLLELVLDEGGAPEEVAEAIAFHDRATPADLRATTALELMEALAADAAWEAFLEAGRVGLEGGREDRYPEAVHRIHARMGEVLLDRGEGREAWRHLLSAAFGLREDGAVNYHLGRYYESQGRWRRALSRYLQACLDPETGPQALEALERVQPQAEAEEPFSVAWVERRLEGRIRNFGIASRFEATPESSTGHGVLVELFTNAHLQGAEAGALAFEGLQRFFEDAPVAFLAWHLDEPALEPLATSAAMDRARALGVARPGVVRVDGLLEGPGAGRLSDREAIFQRLRGQVEGRLRARRTHTIRLQARVEDGRLRGEAEVLGPADPELRFQIVLAQRAALFPGRSGVVLHRSVGRGVLTGSPRGLPWEPEDGRQRIAFERDLKEDALFRRLWLDRRMREGAATTPLLGVENDPAEIVVVAFLMDGRGQVREAAMARALLQEEETP